MLKNKDHPDRALFYYSDNSPITSHSPRLTLFALDVVDSLTAGINCKDR
jgi:hypothetical protein